jgi:hypothetical protein
MNAQSKLNRASRPRYRLAADKYPMILRKVDVKKCDFVYDCCNYDSAL